MRAGRWHAAAAARAAVLIAGIVACTGFGDGAERAFGRDGDCESLEAPAAVSLLQTSFVRAQDAVDDGRRWQAPGKGSELSHDADPATDFEKEYLDRDGYAYDDPDELSASDVAQSLPFPQLRAEEGRYRSAVGFQRGNVTEAEGEWRRLNASVQAAAAARQLQRARLTVAERRLEAKKQAEAALRRSVANATNRSARSCGEARAARDALRAAVRSQHAANLAHHALEMEDFNGTLDSMRSSGEQESNLYVAAVTANTSVDEQAWRLYLSNVRLQREIETLNRLHEELRSLDASLADARKGNDTSVVKHLQEEQKKRVDRVHSQAYVVAQATDDFLRWKDNVTSTRQNGSLAAGAQLADASRRAEILEMEYVLTAQALLKAEERAARLKDERLAAASRARASESACDGDRAALAREFLALHNASADLQSAEALVGEARKNLTRADRRLENASAAAREQASVVQELRELLEAYREAHQNVLEELELLENLPRDLATSAPLSPEAKSQEKKAPSPTTAEVRGDRQSSPTAKPETAGIQEQGNAVKTLLCILVAGILLSCCAVFLAGRCRRRP
eukprot:TRINITY_DN338_c0_g1_i1.p1 TRINITY_DN338_c0_g1~~TRINITY_DN338_c0_g1_i1.p1  ORF type:complete len:589 (-),score=166.95 TRINITY_DN338_c0_g1_i1:57-1766(-)